MAQIKIIKGNLIHRGHFYPPGAVVEVDDATARNLASRSGGEYELIGALNDVVEAAADGEIVLPAAEPEKAVKRTRKRTAKK